LIGKNNFTAVSLEGVGISGGLQVSCVAMQRRPVCWE